MSREFSTVLDFGSEKLSVLVGRRDANNSISVLELSQEKYEGFSEGVFFNSKNLETLISSLLFKVQKNCRKKIKKITVGVPTEFCFSLCKNVSTSFIKPKKITQKDINNLFFLVNDLDKIKTHTLINKDFVYFMLGENNKVSNPINQFETKLSACISFIFVENKFISLVKKILNKFGINKIKFVSSAYAQSLYLFSDEEREKYALLVDCGYITTSVSLSKGKGILNLSSFSLGGGHISADLSKCLRIPFNSAENLCRKVVLCISPTDKDMYDLMVDGETIPISMKVANAIVESRIEVIAQGIKKCFNSWNYNFPDFIPIYLTGGGLSFIKGAKDFLSKILGRNVEIISLPYSQIDKPNNSSVLAVLNFALNCNF